MNQLRPFHESLYDFAKVQPSWWEASTERSAYTKFGPPPCDVTCDVAIIGGGYTGLSAAYHLAREYDIDVVVLEAGAIGWGASGRNGGFCAMGGTLLGARQIAKRYGLEEARRFYAVQREAIELVAALADDEGLDIARQGEAELTVAEKPAHYDALQEECSFLKDQLGVSCRMIPQPAFASTMYSAPHQHGALAMEPGFGLHPLKYCLGLGDAAARAGARIFSNSEVTRWDKAASASGKRHQLQTRTGHTISAEKVIVACNGFMPENLNRQFASRILPLQSQIIVTRPLTDDERAAHGWKMEHPAINSRNVYFYYRMLADGRFMIGGRGDTKGTPQGAEQSAENLASTMARLWPEWRHVDIEHAWRGLVCFTGDLHPSLGRVEDDTSVYFGFGYHGNGVNNATWTGRELARWLATGNDRESPSPNHLPALYRGMTRRIPFAALRPTYARLGIGLHHLKDRLDGIR